MTTKFYNHKAFLLPCLHQSQVLIIKRTMFSFRKLLDKTPKLSSFFNQKSHFSTQAPNALNNFQENQFHLALAMTHYIKTIFSPTLSEIVLKLNNIKNGIMIYKMFTYAKTIANPFLAKKFFQITMEKNRITFPKSSILQVAQKVSLNPALKNIQLENTQEKTSTLGVYEVYAAESFASQSSNIHKITFKSENPNNGNEKTQKKSLSMTGQKNCDVEVTFKTKTGHNFKSFLDILIGKNKHYKGNLIQTNIKDIYKIKQNLKNLITELDTFEKRITFSGDDNQIFQSIKQQLELIHANYNITPQNKTLLIQEQLVELIPIMRKYNKGYNPHFLVFFEEKFTENEKLTNIAKLIQNIFPESLNTHSSNQIMEEAFKKAIPIFLEHYHIDWKLLSPTDTQHYLNLVKKLTSELYLNIMKNFPSP